MVVVKLVPEARGLNIWTKLFILQIFVLVYIKNKKNIYKVNIVHQLLYILFSNKSIILNTIIFKNNKPRPSVDGSGA